ncbi:MAG TPA: hypothetical protein VGD88_03710 [Opitutaceae bacterium]
MLRSTATAGFLVLLGFALTAPVSQAAAERRPVEIPATGWVRLTLDPAAQALADTAWLGDGGGRALPFLRESERARETRPVAVTEFVAGRDAENRSTVEFSLAPEPAMTAGDCMIELTPAPGTPGWAARVEVTRRQGDGAWLRLDDGLERHVYDFGGDGRRLRLSVPRDGQRYRLTLHPVAGTAPAITAASARRTLERKEAVRPVAVEVASVENRTGAWRMRAPTRLRVIGIELELRDRVAPLSVYVTTPLPPREGFPPSERTLGLTDQWIWNLPALATRQLQLDLSSPELVDTLTLHLPEGIQLLGARWLVAEESWLIPAETGQHLFLYTGGSQRTAPGDLARLTLPAIDAALPAATLGAPQPNPHESGERPLLQRIEAILPWLIAVAVVLVAWIGLRLLKRPGARA